jgi:hypothetical protein
MDLVQINFKKKPTHSRTNLFQVRDLWTMARKSRHEMGLLVMRKGRNTLQIYC